MALEYLSYGARYGFVTGKVGWQEDGVRAHAFCGDGGHRGPHTKPPCFIRGCAHNGAFSFPRHDNRFASERWIVALFNRSIEGIHIHVNNFAHPRKRFDFISFLHVCRVAHALDCKRNYGENREQIGEGR